jgi:hypothetical protein
MPKLKTLYDEDFVRWTEQQAAALRRAGSLTAAEARGSNAPLDWKNLAEEIARLGKSDRGELRSQITRILRHILRREAEAMISKQIRAAAELAADDLGRHGEPIQADRARLEDERYTEEQVFGDWFPGDSG